MNLWRQKVLRSGFTLLELLVATTITAVMAVLLLSISQNVLESQRRMVSGARTDRDASFALDIIGNDLEVLTLPRIKSGEALQIRKENVNGSPNCWLMILSNAEVEDSSGLEGCPRAVSYRMGYQDPVSASGTKPMFALYRTVASVADTFSNAIGSTNLADDYWASRQTLSLPSYLVGNVVDFRVRFFDESSGAWIEAEDAADSLCITPDGIVLRKGGTEVWYPKGKQAEVSVTTLSRQGALFLRDGTLTLQEAISRFGKTSSRQIFLPVGG